MSRESSTKAEAHSTTSKLASAAGAVRQGGGSEARRCTVNHVELASAARPGQRLRASRGANQSHAEVVKLCSAAASRPWLHS